MDTSDYLPPDVDSYTIDEIELLLKSLVTKFSDISEAPDKAVMSIVKLHVIRRNKLSAPKPKKEPKSRSKKTKSSIEEVNPDDVEF